MKAIIELSRRGSIFNAVAQQVADSLRVRSPDYRLSVESARSLFAELTPARLDLLDTLRRTGACKGRRTQLLKCSHRRIAPGRTGAC